MADVFISYKREDREQAKALAEALAVRGLDVWWDIELLPGSHFADEIRSIIEQAKVAVVLWADRSVTSDYLCADWAGALTKHPGRMIEPVPDFMAYRGWPTKPTSTS